MKHAAAGCAAKAILTVDDRSKDASPQLKQLKGHKLGDIAVSLLKHLTGQENVGIKAEWLKLQPWKSDAEGAVCPHGSRHVTLRYPSPETTSAHESFCSTATLSIF